MRKLLEPFMHQDPYAAMNGGEYSVRSIYFDTPDLECYFQKLAGVKRRNKVRLRGYNRGEGSEVFFEIKKKVDEPLIKNRAPMTFEAARKILKGMPVEDFVEPTRKYPLAVDDARRFLYHIYVRRMRPAVTVIYEREPFQAILKDRGNDLRITFDKHLRAVAYPTLDELFEEKHPILVNEQYFIMEIKFNRYLPAWVKAIVTTFGLKKGPASKYVLCMDAIRDTSFDSLKMSVGSWQLGVFSNG
jgi:SPX domain protein involved in polyphosphate accumulation